MAGRSREVQRVLLGLVTVLVVGLFWTNSQSGLLELLAGKAANSDYNLLVEGFQAGQLSLNKEVPPGLAQLADPYDPAANRPYRYAPYVLHDLSYFHGKLYLYFGITPVLVLFWPWASLTGRYLLHREAVAIFCMVGFLASVGVLRGFRRRYFSEVSPWIVAAAILGLATSAPILLLPAEVYQVPISCAYALTMLALGAIWLALVRPAERAGWVAAASLAFGLAVGARPPAVLGAIILAVPVAAGWKGPHRLRLLLAAVLPAGLCCLGLALYNVQRFGSLIEFGQHYQLANSRQDIARHFSLHYLWFNFRLYFWAPVHWTQNFPWIGKVVVPPSPTGFGAVENPFGVLVNTPLVWLALAAPLACRCQVPGTGPALRTFLGALVGFFVLSSAPILLYYWSSGRFEAEFLPALVLLAVIGVLGLERALATRPAARRLVRIGWGLLLAYSLAFNLLAGLDRVANERCQYGNALLNDGSLAEAIVEFQAALRIKPAYATAHLSLGMALARSGRMREAVAEFKSAQGDSTSAEDYVSLGTTLLQLGDVSAGVAQYEHALRLRPDSAIAHFSLGYGLQLLGHLEAAIDQYREAVRLEPDSGPEHLGLALALRQAGRETAAEEQNRIAIGLDPKLAGRMP